ncbi:hypothetical protein [Numidum massiliense]|uniref:hypothetical protein n=1 Tax=Numidum massiliense TaxID=1522315 RepID=UPI0006D52F4E|nr:hypothetical protein [Numidum massiliense]
MAESEANVILQYEDHATHERISLTKMRHGSQTRYQVKWMKRTGEEDYQVDFIEFKTYEDARQMFLQYIRTYVFAENSAIETPHD